MGTRTEFDLDRHIANWRKQFLADSTFYSEEVEELEHHVRDGIEHLVETGLSEEDAFHEAIDRLGSADTLRADYKRVRSRWDRLFTHARTATIGLLLFSAPGWLWNTALPEVALRFWVAIPHALSFLSLVLLGLGGLWHGFKHRSIVSSLLLLMPLLFIFVYTRLDEISFASMAVLHLLLALPLALSLLHDRTMSKSEVPDSGLIRERL